MRLGEKEKKWYFGFLIKVREEGEKEVLFIYCLDRVFIGLN